MRIGIRLRTILLVFPVILASLAFIGASSLFSARSGMMRLAMSALSFKAEMFQQYADSQWKLIASQGYSADPDFRKAIILSLGEYAHSLLRSDSEWIVAVDLEGRLALTSSLGKENRSFPADLLAKMRQGITGPVIFGSGADRRYGQSFFFQPLEWYVAVSDGADALFSETRQQTLVIMSGFGLAILVSLGLLVFLSGSIVKPIVRVSAGMQEIIRSNRFDNRIPATWDDEVGDLTRHFNSLCGELERSYQRIHDIALRETEARLHLAEREFEAIIALGKVAEFRDEDTAAHIVRVGLYSKILGEIFYADEDDRRSLFYAAPLHDLGKIGIPDAILLKPGALDPGELAIMRTHTSIGHEILREFKNPALKMGGDIALSHHERFDGRGYPNGLAGSDIPLCGRILAVVDVFDAMTSKRAYKEALPPDRAFDYIEKERGGHFDPEIAAAFLERRLEVLAIMDSVVDQKD